MHRHEAGGAAYLLLTEWRSFTCSLERTCLIIDLYRDSYILSQMNYVKRRAPLCTTYRFQTVFDIYLSINRPHYLYNDALDK